MYADFLHLVAADGGTVIAEEMGHDYLLTLVEDISGFVLLEPARSCTAEVTAQTLIKYCAMMDASRV